MALRGGNSQTGEKHRQLTQLTAQWVESQTERLERECAQQCGIAGLAEDHVGAADTVSIAKHRNALPAHDLVSVGQPELLFDKGLDVQSLQDGGWHNRIDGA
jgi:hypothetical protein